MNLDNVKSAQCKIRGIENGMMRLQELDARRVLSIVNDGILLLYALFVAESFLSVTMFRIHWPDNFHQILVICTVMLLVVKLLLTRTYKWGEVVVMAIFIGVFLMARVVSGYTVLEDVLLFMLALKDMPFRKIVKVYFVTVVFLLVTTIFASQCGMIENLVYHFEGRRERQAFGGCYPTDVASFLVWLGLSWVYIRKEEICLLELIILLWAGVGVWYYCDARLSAIILVLSAVLFLGVKSRYTYIKREKKEKIVRVIPEWAQRIAVLTTPICALGIVSFSCFYSEEQPLMVRLNDMLSGRLALGRLAFEQYDVKLFGQFIPMTGYGKSSLIQLKVDYFFLDSSFVSILMCYGLLVLVCIIFVFTVAAIHAKKGGDYYLVLIIALIAMDCMIEHHMMEFAFNPFLFLVLADMGKKTWRVGHKDTGG